MTATEPAAGPRPADALAALLDGNRRFVEGRPEHGHDVAAAAATSGGQRPHAVVLGCIDSRVPAEAVFDQTFGSICVVRSGAHTLDRAVRGSVGFAVDALGVALVLVLGHAKCGAVGATVEAVRAGHHPDGDVGFLVDEIAPAVREVGAGAPDAVARATAAHVVHTARRLRELPEIATRLVDGRVAVAGAVYDLDTGRVTLLDD